MLAKLESLVARYMEIETQLSDPGVISDMTRFKQLNKQYRDLEPVVEAYHDYKNVMSNLDHAREVIMNEKDEEFRSMAKKEIEELEPRKEAIEQHIQFLLLPQDPQDSKHAIVEIRAGTGGDEASIFAGDLYRMYTRYCENRGWKIELVDFNDGNTGGYKEVIFNVNVDGAYGVLKYESGVHRVQRVPETETQGRVHTSAATVVVMPKMELEEVNINKAE